MEIGKIIESLAEFSPKPLAEVEGNVYIQTHKMIKPLQSQYFPACLYVGFSSELPQKLTGNQQANLICINDCPVPDGVLENSLLNLYLVDKGINQFDVLNKVADIMIEEAAVTAAMRRILDTLYLNVGLQGLVNVASELFGNPLFINDTAFKLLAMTNEYTFEDISLEEEKGLGYLNDEVYGDLREDSIFERSRQSGEIVHSKRSKHDQRWLFKSVKVKDIVVADIAIVDLKRPFKSTDYELLERFANVVAMEMEKKDFYADNKGIMYNYFLADLISGSLNKSNQTSMFKQTVEQRASMIGLKLHRWSKLFVISGSQGEALHEQLPFVTNQVRLLVPDCRWTVFRGNLIFFISRPNKEVFTTNEFMRLRSFCLDNALFIGTSNSFEDLFEAANYYRQALHAAEVGITLCAENPIFEYSKASIYFAIQVILKRNRYEEFVHPAIFEIMDYDNKNETELMKTLEVWISCAGDSNRAAKELYIHRNTLSYRIGRLREITGINLDDGNELLRVFFSLKVMEYHEKILDQ